MTVTLNLKLLFDVVCVVGSLFGFVIGSFVTVLFVKDLLSKM